MINVDFLLAGCNTRCKHCYVNGGPGPMMPVGDALLCIEKLDQIAAYLPDSVSFTLDHEPMNHPNLEQILQAASHTGHIENYHHGMTSGVGLAHRDDREALIRAYQKCGYSCFGITFHGGAKLHDEIVRRKGAFDSAVSAAGFLKSQGVRLQISLMLNRFFPEEAEGITRLLEEVRPDDVYFAIPIFTPHCHMLDFEPYRASLETVRSLRPYLGRWRQDEAKILDQAQRCSVAFGIERLRQEVDLRGLFEEEQEELYLSLHQDCSLYVGNSGAETRRLGDLREMDPRSAAKEILSLPGNRDYGAFYEPEALPPVHNLIKALKNLPESTLYGDFESVIYRGLTELQIPSRILKGV